MKHVSAALTAAVALVLLAAPAAADWDPNDPLWPTNHKMHWPQLPDSYGWDVNFVEPTIIADDWQCSQTGVVDDIHFWFSVRRDNPEFDPVNGIQSVHVTIWDDLPVDDPDNNYGYSMPRNLLRDWTFDSAQFAVRWYEQGYQGWYDPNGPEEVPLDHVNFYQLNLTGLKDIVSDPFSQQEGEIYWLGLSMTPIQGGTAPVELGWKTTLWEYGWNDRPVFSHFPDPGTAEAWMPVEEWPELIPDMAFVITPEPATAAMLLGAGLVGLLAGGRRRRRK